MYPPIEPFATGTLPVSAVGSVRDIVAISIPKGTGSSRLIDAYHERLLDPDPDVRAAAAEAWYTRGSDSRSI